jgi:hypothetical protein
MDFELLGVGLRALLGMMSEDLRARRLGLLKMAERLWEESSEIEQTAWLRKLEHMRQALLKVQIKSDGKMLEAIDDMFLPPPRGGVECQLATIGQLMARANDVWKLFAHLKSPTDYGLAVEMSERCAVNPVSFLHLLHGYRWADAGFPVVKISPKFAAASMCTSALPEVLDDMKPPWRGFVVEMPREPVLYQFDTNEIPRPVAHILVLWSDNVQDNKPELVDCNWSMMLISDVGGISTHRLHSRSRNLCSLYKEADSPLPWVKMDNKDDQSLMLAGRIVVSAICSLTNAEVVERPNREAHERWEHSKRRRFTDEPEARIYQITAPVKLGLVGIVRDYQIGQLGKSWKLTVQMMVVGHHKMQVHGKNRLDRKKIWIQPYWRGPSDAPIAVRPHLL